MASDTEPKPELSANLQAMILHSPGHSDHARAIVAGRADDAAIRFRGHCRLADPMCPQPHGAVVAVAGIDPNIRGQVLML